MRTSAIVLFVVLCSASLDSYAQTAPYVLLKLTILPLSGAAEPRLESILRGTIELALAQGPFRALYSADSGAGEKRPDLELKVLYTFSDGRVALRLSFRDQSATLPPRDEALEQELDPQFDQAVSALIGSLLSESALIVAARPPSASAAGEPAALETAATAQDSAAQAAAAAAIAQAPEPEAGYRALEAAEPPALAPGPPASFETGLGAFVPLGEAGAYFDAAPRLHARYGRYLNEGRNWNLGLAGSFMGFSVSGESQERALNFFALLGGELGYGFRPDAGIDPWIAAGIGPALVVVGAEGESPLAKILPYLSLGLGAKIKLSQGLGLGLGIALSVFFDYGRGSSYLLMGLNPSLAARLEL
jgi:hypothetical protein